MPGILNTGAQNTLYSLQPGGILEIDLSTYKVQTHNHIYEVSIRSISFTLTQDIRLCLMMQLIYYYSNRSRNLALASLPSALNKLILPKMVILINSNKMYTLPFYMVIKYIHNICLIGSMI